MRACTGAWTPSRHRRRAINREAYLSFMRVGGLLNQAMHHLNAGNILVEPASLSALARQLHELRAATDEVRRLLTRNA